jgi:hypothetical protein
MVTQQTETERRKKQCGGFMPNDNSVSRRNLLEHYTVPFFTKLG